MIITDDHLDAMQAAVLEAAEKLAPVDFGLAERDAHAQQHAMTVRVDPHGDQHGTGYHRAAVPHFLVTSVEHQVRDLAVLRSGPEQELNQPTRATLALNPTYAALAAKANLQKGCYTNFNRK